MYAEVLLDHVKNPRNVGTLEHPDGEGVVGDPGCGDCVQMQIAVEAGVIKDIKFLVFGCPAAIATTSIFTDFVKGRTIEEGCLITDLQVSEAAGGLSEPKIHCSNLAVAAFREALHDYFAKRGQADR